MASVRALTDLTLSDLWREVKDPAALWGDLSQQTVRTVKNLLENRMQDELASYLQARRYVRLNSRRGYRNGAYVRRLTTTWGTIPDLEIPRARDGGFRPSAVPRYQQRTTQVDALIRSVFLGGVSTRQAGRILAPLLGDAPSASTVSTITKTLDRAVDRFHRRPVADAYTYLFLDAVSLRVKTPDGTRRRLVLVAYGISCGGQRELIDYRLARYENQSTWEAFLTSLACRGLVGSPLQLITTDGHRGLHAALDLVYPHVPRQACWVHVLRNVAQHLRVRDRERCLHMARRIYQAPSRPAAERALRNWIRAWRGVAPKAVACLQRDWEALLAFYHASPRDWRRVRTTNAIERVFREVRRRTRPMTCFTNLASCDRIVFAIGYAVNERWKGRSLWRESTQDS
jgi:transposase-like protein